MDAAGNLAIAGTLTESSDRNKKTDITPANASKLLQALKQLDVSTWRYKGDEVTHLGPMAQDFHRLFGVGTEETISPRDVASLALVVAQELERRLADAEVRNTSLATRVERIEDVVRKR